MSPKIPKQEIFEDSEVYTCPTCYLSCELDIAHQEKHFNFFNEWFAERAAGTSNLSNPKCIAASVIDPYNNNNYKNRLPLFVKDAQIWFKAKHYY